MKNLIPLVLLSLAGPPALAQTFTIRLPTEPTNAAISFGPSDCESNWSQTLDWTVSSAMGTPTGPLKLWATKGECGDEPNSTGDVSFEATGLEYPTWAAVGKGSFTVDLRKLPSFTQTPQDDGGVAGLTCGDRNRDGPNKICGSYAYKTSLYDQNSVVARASHLQLNYDSTPPKRPVITAVDAFDDTARLTFTIDSDTTVLWAQLKAPDDADFTTRAEVASSVTAISLSGLRTHVTYRLRLIAFDAAGNESEKSDEKTATPISTSGFWGVYREAGGTEPGGCNVAPILVPGAALLLLLQLRRALARRRDP
jgi:hypothetical protein